MQNKQIYTLKVSADNKTFRIIEIQSDKSLDDLATVILNSFKFDKDYHAFGFYNNYKSLYSSDERYELFVDLDYCKTTTENAKSVENTIIKDVFIIKKKMAFLFDYGDEWIFLIECKNISEPIAKTKYPRVIEKVGKSPEQYPF